MHCPAIGSQNGVEQFAGTGTDGKRPRSVSNLWLLTTEACLLAIRHLLWRVGLIRGRWHRRASILSDRKVNSVLMSTVQGTHASEEGKVRERAVTQETGFVLGNTVADLLARVDLGGRASEGRQVIQLRSGNRVADPVEQLTG